MINADVDEKTEAKQLAKSIYMFCLPRDQSLVDQPTNNKMPVTDELKKFIMSVPAVELKAGKVQNINIEFMPGQVQQERYVETEAVMQALKQNVEFLKEEAKVQQAAMKALQRKDDQRMQELDDMRRQLEDAQNEAKAAGYKVPRREHTSFWDVAKLVLQVFGGPAAPSFGYHHAAPLSNYDFNPEANVQVGV